MKKVFISVILSLVLVLAMAGPVSAAPLTSITVTPTDPTVSTATTYTVEFDVSSTGALDENDTITVTFPTGFTVPASQTLGVSVDDGGGPVTGTSTTSDTNRTVTFTLGADTIAVDATVTMTIVSPSYPTNPGTAGTYTVNIETGDEGTATQIDQGQGVATIGGNLSGSVTVKTYISATITDQGVAGIHFGSLDPGATEEPEAAQGASYGAVTIEVGTEVNIAVKAGTQGAAWTGGVGMAVGVTTFNTSNTYAATAMTTAYQQLGVDITAGAGGTRESYHWINVPSGQDAGDYSSTFYYKVDTSL